LVCCDLKRSNKDLADVQHIGFFVDEIMN